MKAHEEYTLVSMPFRNSTNGFNPFTPKSDQFQISPAASPEILHHTVWLTQMKDDYTTHSHYVTYTFLFKG